MTRTDAPQQFLDEFDTIDGVVADLGGILWRLGHLHRTHSRDDRVCDALITIYHRLDTERSRLAIIAKRVRNQSDPRAVPAGTVTPLPATEPPYAYLMETATADLDRLAG